jgi:hypothetical protein
MLEAILARQQRLGAQNGVAANEDKVRSMLFQSHKGKLDKEYIWFPGDLRPIHM